MKVPLSWLREFVEIDLPIAELAARITDAIAEVEGWTAVGGDWDPELVRVAEVTAVEPHPNADRLRLATVTTGDASHTVVCGAPNVAAGQKVAFATEGAMLFDGKTGKPAKLKRSTIRGVESAGMVLSERELGLSDEHEGILVLPAQASVGRPLVEEMGDVILDVSTWANRADLLGILGFAREVAAMLGRPLREPDLAYTTGEGKAADFIEVTIEDPDLCRRFTASLVKDVTVAPSPAWMQDRLRRVGVRPINNVVDVTNYVMVETGQPLHAFDYDLVRGARIIARRARPGERITTLDDVDRELDPEMLMICDAEGPTGIGGIMGGGLSEVHDATRNVLLEVANFAPGSIRRTSGQLKLRTEASLRFEKGIGPEIPAYAQARALHLLQQVSGGTIAEGIVDVYPARRAATPIELPAARIEQVLGIPVPDAEVQRILSALGFEVAQPSAGVYTVVPPPWRTDVEIHDDVVEEVARIYGYERIPPTSLRGSLPSPEPRPLESLRERVRDLAVSLGFYEVINYTLVNERMLGPVVDPDDQLRSRPMTVVNPVASQHRSLRTSLRGSLLQSYSANRNLSEGPLRLFEIGAEYLAVEADLPHERQVLCALLGGSREDRWKRAAEQPLDFFDAKGAVEAMLGSLGVQVVAHATKEFGLLPGHTAGVVTGDEAIGVIGQVHPATATAFDIDEPVFLLELWLEPLVRHLPERPDYDPPSRHPSARIDIALVVDDSVPAGDVVRAIRNHRARDVTIAADLFDEYRGPGLPPGKRSIAVELRLQSPERTLTDDDVARVRDGLLARLEKETGATLRA